MPHLMIASAHTRGKTKTEKTYAALERTTVDIVAGELADCHGGILVGVHLDESKTTVGLEPSLNNITKLLEQGKQVVLGGVWSQVANVASGLPGGGLGNNHVIALDAVSWEVVMTVGCCRSHSHGSHSSLLGERRLALLVGPVAADSARSQPFTVHAGQGLLSVCPIAECNETVTTRAASLHIPHDTCLRDGTKCREGLEQDFIVDFIGKVSNEDVEVVGSVLLVRLVGLIRPVDTDFLHEVVSFRLN